MMRLVRELKFGEIYVNRPGGDVPSMRTMQACAIAESAAKMENTAWMPISRKKTIYVNYA